MRFKEFKRLVYCNDIKLNSNPDGRKHFIYRITTPKNEYYYGSRSSDKIDIGIRYFTSSTNKIFRENFMKNTQKFKVKVVKVFDNILDKNIFESFLHQKFDVKLHPKFINKSNQTINGFDTTGRNNGLKTHTPETKKLISDNHYDCSGQNNANAKHIQIFNSNNSIVLETFGNFTKSCKNLDLPWRTLRSSYQNSGKRIWPKDYKDYSHKYNYSEKYYEKYQHWYAIIKSENIYSKGKI